MCVIVVCWSFLPVALVFLVVVCDVLFFVLFVCVALLYYYCVVLILLYDVLCVTDVLLLKNY